MKRSAYLLIGELRRITFIRYAASALGGIVVPLFLLTTADPTHSRFSMAGAFIATALLFVGEVAERIGFFSAMSGPRMPGGIGG
ncbi:MAG: hypothetical protein R3A47_03715 [Polyangiales bacterium]